MKACEFCRLLPNYGRKQRLDFSKAERLVVVAKSARLSEFWVARRMPWGIALAHEFAVCSRCFHCRPWRLEWCDLNREIAAGRLAELLSFVLPYAPHKVGNFYAQLAKALLPLCDRAKAVTP